MKTKLLKSILSLLLIFSTVLTLFSCNNVSNVDNELTDETATSKRTYRYHEYNKIKDFEIIQVEDSCRLIFNDPEYYAQMDIPDHYGVALNSIEELRDGLINGTFDEDVKLHIFLDLPKDEHGIIVPDPNNLYIPVLPKDCSANLETTMVAVFGSYYSYGLDIVTDKYDINTDFGCVIISCLTYNDYNEKLKKETDIVKDYPDSMWTHESGKDSIIYSLQGEPFKREQVRYTISNEDKTMLVIEKYHHYEDKVVNFVHYTEKTVRDEIIVFGTSNGAYFSIFFAGSELNFFADGNPVDPEWLLEFDVEKYVPDQNT